MVERKHAESCVNKTDAGDNDLDRCNQQQKKHTTPDRGGRGGLSKNQHPPNFGKSQRDVTHGSKEKQKSLRSRTRCYNGGEAPLKKDSDLGCCESWTKMPGKRREDGYPRGSLSLDVPDDAGPNHKRLGKKGGESRDNLRVKGLLGKIEYHWLREPALQRKK